MRERGKDGAPRRILLDFDSTDDPVHGDQEGGYYHGFYEERILHPLVVFDGETDQLITAVLRPGDTHASRGALAVLKRIVKRLRQEWPAAEIEIRADAGFAVPAIYEYCEEEGIDYTIGLVSNPRLEALAEPLLQRAVRESEEREGEKVRLVADGTYRAGSWDRVRRVLYKAEVLEKGANTRFVVTSRIEEPPEKLYDWYVKRGEARVDQGLQARPQSGQAKLPPLFCQPVSAFVARGGLLVVRHAAQEARGAGSAPDATRHTALEVHQDRRQGTPVANEGTPLSRLGAPRPTPLERPRATARNGLMNNSG